MCIDALLLNESILPFTDLIIHCIWDSNSVLTYNLQRFEGQQSSSLTWYDSEIKDAQLKLSE